MTCRLCVSWCRDRSDGAGTADGGGDHDDEAHLLRARVQRPAQNHDYTRLP